MGKEVITQNHFFPSLFSHFLLASHVSLSFSHRTLPLFALSPQRNPVSPLGLELFEGDPELCCSLPLLSSHSLPSSPLLSPSRGGGGERCVWSHSYLAFERFGGRCCKTVSPFLTIPSLPRSPSLLPRCLFSLPFHPRTLFFFETQLSLFPSTPRGQADASPHWFRQDGFALKQRALHSTPRRRGRMTNRQEEGRKNKGRE